MMMTFIQKVIRRPLFPALALLLAATFGLSACDAFVGSENGRATLRVHMIDAPFPFDLVDSTNVTISRVEVYGESTGSVTISEETETYNLLDLRNGVSALLGEVTVEPGTYHEVRLYVDDASIVLTDGQEFDIKVPSERIKVLLNGLSVDDAEDVTLTIDFDVSKSFVVQGNPLTSAGIKGFLFKPVVVPAGVQRRGGDDDGANELEAEIDALGANYIEINGLQYFVNDETEFEGGDFASLAVGTYVEIEYVEQEDGTLLVLKVEIENPDEDDGTEEDDDTSSEDDTGGDATGEDDGEGDEGGET